MVCEGSDWDLMEFHVCKWASFSFTPVDSLGEVFGVSSGVIHRADSRCETTKGFNSPQIVFFVGGFPICYFTGG